MKKILAALIAVVMIVSCMSVAFAGTINVWTLEDKDVSGAESSSRWRSKIAVQVNEGDVISFWVKPSAEGADMYVRCLEASVCAKYVLADGTVGAKDVYSGQTLSKNALAEVDGWYYIECVAQSTSATGFEVSVDAQNVTGGKMTACQVAGVKVNGEDVELVGYKAGAALTTTTMEEPVIPQEPTEDATETEDATVEETGVVSIAVVAVAAVIGGAVVLKKREF